MGFYIRKTIRLGGVNLNLSKSGLGVSAGVRGFRVGMNGRGTYVHMGRGGLYYRKQVSWGSQGRRSQPHSTEYVQSELGEDLVRPIPVSAVEAGDADVLAHFRPKPSWAIVYALLVGLGLFSVPTSRWLAGAFLAGCGAVFVWRCLEQHRNVLVYDLEGEALGGFETFVGAFEEFFRSSRMWLYESRRTTTDWKRNAGASHLMKRRAAVALSNGDPAVRANLSIPVIQSGPDRVYFLPDMVVFRQGSTVTSQRYDRLQLEIESEDFVETGSVPADAEVIGHTWRYPNKDGGPDRRFNNNYRIPRCLYQAVAVGVPGVFERTFSKSRVAAPRPFRTALSGLIQAQWGADRTEARRA